MTVTGSKKSASRKTTAKQISAKADTGAPQVAPSAADAVDEQLARYRSMRNFSITDEPSGEHSHNASELFPFCVQKHAASHLHYDFRLGWNGVLKSWAIAKGPSYFTGDKRLAVQVEDHPIEYGGFEGIIPKGQYGGGTVMLWDQGTWAPQAAYPDVDAGLRDGSLKFILYGTKLKGKWALVRMGGKWAKEKKPNWLLIKEHDEFERVQDDIPITEAEPNSVVTGRTIDDIARNEDHVWNSKDTNSGSRAWFRKEPSQSIVNQTRQRQSNDTIQHLLRALPEENQPGFISPELASMAEVPPSGEGWLHELKLDGYRIQAHKDGDRVQMLTRTGLDWTARMKSVADEIAKLPTDKVTLDGELAVVAPNGTTSFAALQSSLQEGAKHLLTYFAFDLLHLAGRNTRELPLKERKDILSLVLSEADSDRLRVSEHIETGGKRLLREACKLQAEGIVSKRASARYLSGRGSDWIKTKCLHEQEFVVGGYTLPANGIYGVGALLVGYFRDGKLIYAGRTGTGFTQKTHQMLRDSLEKISRKTPAFEEVPQDAKKGARWVSPEMVVQVRFAAWSADNLIRQSAYLGIREDKAAKEVVREAPDMSLGPRRARQHIHSAGSVAPSSTPNAEHAPVRLTHPAKVLDESSGMTKQMLADYYWNIAEWLLPYIADRPVSLVRCPDGIGRPSFFQKHVNATLPKNIGSVNVPNKKTGAIEAYITVNAPGMLASLAQLGVLELHPWGSRNEDLEHPDRLIFDIDPDETLGWIEIKKAAEEVRTRLKSIGLESFVKTTGGKGLHIVAPIEPTLTWAQLKEFARSFVVEMEKATPHRYLTKMTKAARSGRIYLDYLRNEREATSVAAYSPRARSGVPVSMPLSWRELNQSDERPVFRVVDFPEWRERLNSDPWAAWTKIQQNLKI